MPEPILFHTDLYRRDALELAAHAYAERARVELAEAGQHVMVRFEALRPEDSDALLDEFRNQVFSETARRMRDQMADAGRPVVRSTDEPPWSLIVPYSQGDEVGLGWQIESLSPIRAGATTLILRHPERGEARVAIRRNSGAPLGVAHTPVLDLFLMNGGRGSTETDGSIGRVLRHLAQVVGAAEAPSAEVLESLLPHAEGKPGPAPGERPDKPAGGPVRHLAPHVDPVRGEISFSVDETGLSRLALFDAILRFADRCYCFLDRSDDQRLVVTLKPRSGIDTEALRVLTRDVTRALNHVAHGAVEGSGPQSPRQHSGLPGLAKVDVDLPALITELVAADPLTLGLGFQPERGPGHENLRVLNIRGTGACNSECVFCIEKFNPTHRAMPKADATRQLILESGGRFDMLFFASGEPTIHPKLFEYVDLAKSVGFTRFGMSSHFRTFADPAFALRTIEAGFEYFDISLHAADAATQLEVNPIADNGESLVEALKGLANIYRLAEALGKRISVTHKIVVSRLNVIGLKEIFHATYDRGVRHFILQPVRTLGLAPELQELLAISEEEIRPYLNDLLRSTEGLGALLKPYGFSRQHLYTGDHVETEQNRVKNIYGRSRRPLEFRELPSSAEERPTDGRHWVEVRVPPAESCAFPADGKAPILDVALERGLDLPFGCRMGSCGMCAAHLREGKVDQSDQIFLTDEQMAKGYVLLCQARPLADVVVELCTDEEIDEL